MTLLITEADVLQLVTLDDAIPIMEQTFRWAGEGLVENPPRFRMPIRKGFLQFGPAAVHPMNMIGFKLWANFGTPLRQVWNFLFGTETSELEAIVHAFAIGRMRTSAVSAVAAKYLSPPDAAVVGMYGTGRQAEGQLEAICKVRPIRKAIVYSRKPDPRAAFCTRMTERLGIDVVPAGEPHEAALADIIVTITNSEDPVLFGSWVTRPSLIIAAGANHWYKRELDLEAVARADLIVTDEKEQSKVEGGNLLYAIGHGRLSWDRVEELGDVVAGRVQLPDFQSSVRLFCSHGLAIEDVAISVHALRRARELGLGQNIAI